MSDKLTISGLHLLLPAVFEHESGLRESNTRGFEVRWQIRPVPSGLTSNRSSRGRAAQLALAPAHRRYEVTLRVATIFMRLTRLSMNDHRLTQVARTGRRHASPSAAWVSIM